MNYLCTGLSLFIIGSLWTNLTNASVGFLDLESLPDTSFSCEGKVIGGYYADIETGCQMFHVCTLGGKGEINDIKFLCLNGTIFDQETRVCERLDEVDCSQSAKFYDLNLDLYGSHGQILGRNAPPGGGIITDEQTQQASENANYDDYEEYDEIMDDPSTTTTTTAATTVETTTTTTTVAPPVVEELLLIKLDSLSEANIPTVVATTVVDLNTTLQQQQQPQQPSKTIIVHKEVTMSTSVEHHVVTNSHSTKTSTTPHVSTTSTTTTTTTTPSPDDEEVRGLLEELAADVPRISQTKFHSLQANFKQSAIRTKRDDSAKTTRRPSINRRRKTTTTASSATTTITTTTGNTETTTQAEASSTELPVVLPVTNFTCTGKIVGGLYADVETDCRMFHICSQGKKNRVLDFKFLCGSGTLFDQKTRTCQEAAKVQCHLSQRFYHLNDHSQPQEPDYEDDFDFPRVPSSAAALR